MDTAKPSLDQRRALHAWKATANAKNLKSDDKKDKEAGKKDYARQAKRLPMRIKTSGLGQSLAFLRAKGGQAKGQLLQDIGRWVLLERGLVRPTPTSVDDKSLIEEITTRDSSFLRRATEEVLLYLQWLTRFTEAEIKTDD